MRVRVGLVAALALLALVTLPPLSTSRLYVWPWRGWALLVWALPLALLVVRSWRRGLAAPTLTDRLILGGGALLAAAAVTSASLSPFRALSLPHVWPTLGGVALLLWLREVLADAPARTRTLAAALVAVGTALSLTSLLQWTWTPGFQWAMRNAHPFGHSNYTAGALVLLLPWLAWGTVRLPGAWRLGSAGATLAGLIVLASTSSRGGVLALGAAGGLVGLIALFRARWSPGRKALLLFAGLGLVSLGVVSNERLRDLVVHRRWSDHARESNVQRTAMLEAGQRLGARRPLIGWGPGTVPITYPNVRAALSGGVDTVLQLHNTPLQLWATVGAAAALAAVLLGAGLVAARPWRQPITSETTAAAVSLGGYALFALTDHQLDVPLMNAVAAANLALLTRRRHGSPAPASTPSLPTRALPALVLTVLVAVPLVPTVRDTLGRRAYSVDDYERASAWMPADPYYWQQAASRHLLARQRARSPEEAARLTAAARAALERSLATSAHTEYAHFNLGWLALERGEPAEAERHFRAAAALAPPRGSVYLGLGFALQVQGRIDAAVRAFALEWVNDPTSAASPLWADPDLAETRRAVLAELARLSDAADASSAVTDAAALRLRIEWIRWWARDSNTPPTRAHSQASEAWISALPVIQASEAPPPGAMRFAWAHLYAAWRAGAWERLTSDVALASALQARAERLRGEGFLRFLRADIAADPGLVRYLRRVRPGYGVVTFHPDGAPPTDVPPVAENRLVATYLADLYPAKGTLPARYLLNPLPNR